MTAEPVPPQPEARTLHLTAAVHQEGEWFVARCLEMEAVSQGETVEEALVNLREVVEIYLEEEPEEFVPVGLTAFAPLNVRLPA